MRKRKKKTEAIEWGIWNAERKEMVHRAPEDRVKAGCQVSALLVAEAASLIEVEASLEPKNAH
jgi:hypothetical protein